MRTRAFWLLSLYTVLVYPVQAGVSLHQAPHLIERGLSPIVAATVISFFSVMSAVASFGVGFLPRRWPVRYTMLAAAALLSTGTFGLIGVVSAEDAYLAAGLFGLGIGGIMTLLPVAWADYFGRESYGAIRGVALTLQVLAQAAGPLLSGALRDWSGTYTDLLLVFGVLSRAGGRGGACSATPPLVGSARPARGCARWKRTRRRQRDEETGFALETNRRDTPSQGRDDLWTAAHGRKQGHGETACRHCWR